MAFLRSRFPCRRETDERRYWQRQSSWTRPAGYGLRKVGTTFTVLSALVAQTVRSRAVSILNVPVRRVEPSLIVRA